MNGKFALALIGIGLAVAVVPRQASACMPAVSMAPVDQALASTRLKGGQLADANALRDDMAEAVKRGDSRVASHLEVQVMTLMGYQQSEGPVSRGGCNRTWVRKNG